VEGVFNAAYPSPVQRSMNPWSMYYTSVPAQFSTTQYSTVLHNTVQYYTVQYCTCRGLVEAVLNSRTPEPVQRSLSPWST